MANRRRRKSVWKNGKEYFWNPNDNQYERWITIGKRHICESYNEGIQLPRDMKPQEFDALLKCVKDSGDEENYWRLKEILSSFAKQNGERSFSLYQKPNPNARLIETATEYIEQIDLADRRKYQEGEANIRRTLVQRHADNRNELMEWERIEPTLLKKRDFYADLEKSEKLNAKDFAEYTKTRREIFRGQSRSKEIKEPTNQEKVKRIKDRENVKERLRLLFPNRGGKELLDRETQRNIRELFAKYKQEDIAIQVIEVYNAIGRCYNIRDKDFDQPTVVIAQIPRTKDGKMVLGKYKDNKITINEEIKNNSYLLYRTLTHELGHWIESSVCKRGPFNKIWLKQKQGDFIPLDGGEDNDEIAPFDAYPRLCADDYAQVVHKNSTELISVAMQELVDDPEVFARRCREHFNLLLDTLREIL